MPCRYDPGPEDFLRTEKQKNERLTADLDKLTRENDQLREALLNLINDKNYVLPQAVVEKVSEDQTEHRKEDLARLEAYFRAQLKSTSDFARERVLHEYIGAIVTADPTMPLEPQLGFDPDDF